MVVRIMKDRAKVKLLFILFRMNLDLRYKKYFVTLFNPKEHHFRTGELPGESIIRVKYFFSMFGFKFVCLEGRGFE